MRRVSSSNFLKQGIKLGYWGFQDGNKFLADIETKTNKNCDKVMFQRKENPSKSSTRWSFGDCLIRNTIQFNGGQ